MDRIYERLANKEVHFQKEHSDPIKWHPREHNVQADKLSNITLDRKQTMEHFEEELINTIDVNANILLHTNGACRGEGHS